MRSEPEAESGAKTPDSAVVTKLNFRTPKPQLFEDRWRNKVRRCEYVGACATCSRRCYEFADGDNDPRGPLGDHAIGRDVWLSKSERALDALDVKLVQCFNCENEYVQARRFEYKVWSLVSNGTPETALYRLTGRADEWKYLMKYKAAQEVYVNGVGRCMVLM